MESKDIPVNKVSENKDKKGCLPCERVGLRPFTKENILYYYGPMHGLVSYGALSINVMNPSLAVR